SPTPRLLTQERKREREAADRTPRVGQGCVNPVDPLPVVGDHEVGGKGASDRRAGAVESRAVTLAAKIAGIAFVARAGPGIITRDFARKVSCGDEGRSRAQREGGFSLSDGN